MNDVLTNYQIPKSPVYIQVDEKNRITRCDGGYSIQNITNFDEWIKIDEGTGDKYNLCQSHYFGKPLYNMDMTHNFIYDNGECREATEDEIKQELAEIEANRPPVTDPQSDIQEMLVDQEYRLTLLELGV